MKEPIKFNTLGAIIEAVIFFITWMVCAHIWTYPWHSLGMLGAIVSVFVIWAIYHKIRSFFWVRRFWREHPEWREGLDRKVADLNAEIEEREKVQ
jgi:hypothetical protein